jgi:hypothetical protein
MRRWHVLVAICIISSISFWFWTKPQNKNERAMKNYSTELMTLSKKHKVPWKYLMALTILECSGKDPCSSRFEKHVFEKLKKLQDGKIKKYGALRRSDIDDASDDALKNLSSSWGPFQIMGYHCIKEGITVGQLRSTEGLSYAVQWINKNYGERLRKQEFQDSFHIHNTGKPFPKSGTPSTHDPQYVFHGISLMKEFEDMRTDMQ